MLSFNRFLTFFIFTTLVASLTGCEQINKIKDKFSKDKKASSEISSAPALSKADGPMSADALARIGSWTLTKEEFEDRLAALKEVVPDYNVEDVESRRLVLEELVRQQLLIADAEASGLASSKDITDAVEEFRRTLIVREVARMKTENVTVSDEEAMEFYDQNKELLIEPLELSVSEIVVETQEKANAVLAEILQGADFAMKAKENSISASAADGGSLGFITDVPFPEMGSALIPLDEGSVSGVFSGPDGFYIVKVDEKKGGEQIPFDEIRDDIIQNQTLIKQQQAVLDYIEGLKKTYKVELNEDML